MHPVSPGLSLTPSIEHPQGSVHSTAITIHFRHARETIPCPRILGNQQPLWKTVAMPRDTFQHAALTEAVVVTAEAVVLKEYGEGR